LSPASKFILHLLAEKQKSYLKQPDFFESIVID